MRRLSGQAAPASATPQRLVCGARCEAAPNLLDPTVAKYGLYRLLHKRNTGASMLGTTCIWILTRLGHESLIPNPYKPNAAQHHCKLPKQQGPILQIPLKNARVHTRGRRKCRGTDVSVAGPYQDSWFGARRGLKDARYSGQYIACLQPGYNPNRASWCNYN